MSRDATNYDVTKDGQRFLVVRRASDPGRAEQQLNVVVRTPFRHLSRVRCEWT